MKLQFTLFSGIFSLMALSNAIVPVLPVYGGSSAQQGTVYASYFFGAFISTLPAGLLADRFGRIPIIRTALALTAVSGFLLFFLTSPVPVTVIRFAEGVGSGFFVAAALSCVNSRRDHERQSGYFIAFMNAGLVTGLLLTGWMGSRIANPAAGVLLFSCMTLVAACSSLLIHEHGHRAAQSNPALFIPLLRDYRHIWLSSVVLIGITGVVSSLYPKYSAATSESLGFWIAGMSVATMVAALVVSHVQLPPLPTIRLSAVLMAAGVLLTFYSSWGFILLGALAGVVMIAQMALLAQVHHNQGMIMGLFSTSSYLGMAVLPFIAGLCADTAGFFIAFCLTASTAILVAITISGSCCIRSAPAGHILKKQ
jgi:MFS family permease